MLKLPKTLTKEFHGQLLQAACDVVNSQKSLLNEDYVCEAFAENKHYSAIDKLKQTLLKAGCVDE